MLFKISTPRSKWMNLGNFFKSQFPQALSRDGKLIGIDQ